MASKPKPTSHSKTISPSNSPSHSRSHVGSPTRNQEEQESTTTAHTHHPSEQLSLESPEVQSLIHKLQTFSISPQISEVSQSSATSQFHLSHPLTRLQSGKLGIKPIEFPLPERKRTKKHTEESDSGELSSTSSISSPHLQSQPPTPPLHIVVHQGTEASTSQSAHPSISSSSHTSGTPIVVSTAGTITMVDPWTRPGAVNMPAPLHPLPDAPEKWLPKFKPDDGTQAEEHINNFMLSVNLKGVAHEDVVVRLFPYTLQGSAGSWYFSLPSGSITDWDTCQEQFLTKYGDDRSLATLINDLSNLRIEHREPIKEFNARFNKLLNKIPTASKPSEQIRSEWYITALPANIAIFVDRVGKPTLVENMKEALDVEKRINSLEKKAALEDRKAKKVSFKEDSKKKSPKDPYDMEGLQKVLKTLSNEMIDIKKQVAETSSKRPFRTYKKTKTKPPNVISNADSDQEEEEEEATPLSDDEEEVAECHGMWDFILPGLDTDNEEEAFPVTTRSKGTPEPAQVTSKKRSAGATTTKEKIPTKKPPAVVPQNHP